MSTTQEAEFKTVDGVTLRGHVYHANSREPAPGVVMCPGFNGVKELGGLPDVAAAFQAAGITTLLHDPRSVGVSDGQPRNDIDPFQQTQDYSDAVTYLSSLSGVDSRRVGLWGISLSGSVALSTASFDKRVSFVVAGCPVAEYSYDEAKMQRLLRTCFKDRESQVKGNPPFYVPMVDDSGESPAGLDFGLDHERAAEWAKGGLQLAENHVNRTTIQSYHKLAMWHPWPMWERIGQTPVLFLVPEHDTICPPEKQIRHLRDLKGPKRYHVQKGKGHLDLFVGDHMEELVKLQTEFIWDAVTGRVGQEGGDAEGEAK